MQPLRRGSAIRGSAILLAGLCCLTLNAGSGNYLAALPQHVQTILRARMPASGKPPELTADDGTFRAAADLPCFYDRRGFVPAWIGEAGLRRHADELLAALAASPADGLRSERYRLADLQRRVAQVRLQPTPGDLAEVELRLTDAFLRLAADLRNGAVNPELIYSDCEIDIPATDLAAVLESALAAGEVQQALAGLAPSHAGYRALKAALATYREMAARSDVPALAAGPSLRLGDRDERIAVLRARLEAAGEGDLFDDSLAAAVEAFQERHGLEADAVVGPATLAALNVPAAERARQIAINLDRWRWLPSDLGERHVLVNIAGFALELVAAGKQILAMKIVAGKPSTRTPMFSGTMTHVVLNPYWNVPPGILQNEVLPRIRRDPGYLAREGMEMLPGGKVRQRPGPRNALGRIKFIFPNRFNVYLHDTPARTLFSRSVRTFSHGCIRIEKPFELAEVLLQDDPAWTTERIRAAIATGRERWVPIPRPLPVHLGYWTAWVDEAGTVQFRNDVYGRDKPLYEILEPRQTVTAEPSARKAELGRPESVPAKRSP